MSNDDHDPAPPAGPVDQQRWLLSRVLVWGAGAMLIAGALVILLGSRDAKIVAIAVDATLLGGFSWWKNRTQSGRRFIG